MILSEDEILFFKKNGYLLKNNVFSEAEVSILLNSVKLAIKKKQTYTHKDPNGLPRVIFASHKTDKQFEQLIATERLVTPAMQLLDSEVYVHQTKIATKESLTGQGFYWHQDFSYFHYADNIPLPNLINCSVFLNDVTEFNGPVFMVPGSHTEVTEPGIKKTTFLSSILSFLKLKNSLDLYDQYISLDLIKKVLRKYGIDSPKGPAGSVLFFHCNIFHASLANISEINRYNYYVTYNQVGNIPKQENQEHRHRDFAEYRNYTKIISNDLPFK